MSDKRHSGHTVADISREMAGPSFGNLSRPLTRKEPKRSQYSLGVIENYCTNARRNACSSRKPVSLAIAFSGRGGDLEVLTSCCYVERLYPTSWRHLEAGSNCRANGRGHMATPLASVFTSSLWVIRVFAHLYLDHPKSNSFGNLICSERGSSFESDWRGLLGISSGNPVA